MKIMSIVSAVVSTLVLQSAQASYFQTSCSNGDRTVAMANGHDKNTVTLTEYSYNNGPQYNQIELNSFDVDTEVLKVTDLHSEKKGGCVAGQPTGFVSYTSVSYQNVRIKMADGSLFSDKILGVSQDRKTVEAFLICEREVNNVIPCSAQ